MPHQVTSTNTTANVSYEAYDHETHEFINGRFIVVAQEGTSEAVLRELVLERLAKLKMERE